jgi:hypothetical protein
MDAVGTALEGEVRSVVEDERDIVIATDPRQQARTGQQRAGREVLLP